MGIERLPYFSVAKEWCSYNLEMIFALDHYRIWYRWFGGFTSTNFCTVNKRRGHTWPQWSTLDSPSSPVIGRPQIRRRSGEEVLVRMTHGLNLFFSEKQASVGIIGIQFGTCIRKQILWDEWNAGSLPASTYVFKNRNRQHWVCQLMTSKSDSFCWVCRWARRIQMALMVPWKSWLCGFQGILGWESGTTCHTFNGVRDISRLSGNLDEFHWITWLMFLFKWRVWWVILRVWISLGKTTS